VSTFHILRIASGATWENHTLDAFIESLIHEQDKLIKMGTVKESKENTIVVHESGNTNSKYKHKSKRKKDIDPREGGNFKHSNESSRSKVGKGKKWKHNCCYCNHGNYLEYSYLKEIINLIANHSKRTILGTTFLRIPRRSNKTKVMHML
jgi:hypothetical protein